MTRPRQWTVGLLALGVILRVLSLVSPCLSDDEAIYAVVAREMRAGHLLYQGVVNHKPPLIYLTYAVTQALGPHAGMLVLHALVILVVFATALLLRQLVRRAGADQRTAWTAALLYTVFTTTFRPCDSLAANCELFMMLPLTASVLLYLDAAAGRGAWRLAAAGALVGVAMLYKYQAGVQLPLYGAHWLLTRRRSLRALADSALLGLGLAATMAASVLALWSWGDLDAAWFWFRFNFHYIADGGRSLQTLGFVAVRIGFVVVSAALLYALGLSAALRSLRRGHSPLARFATAWLAVSALAVATGGRFFGHYFHQVTAPLAVLAAPAVADLWQRGRRRLLAWGIAVPAALFLLYGCFEGRILDLAGRRSPAYAEITAFIIAHSSPADRLVIWGNSPVLYFEAERPLGSRFVFSNYLSGMSPATRTQSDPSVSAAPAIVPEAWDMFLADLGKRRPLLFIDASLGDVNHYGKFPPALYPRLAALLAHDYEPLAEVAGVRVLRRRSP